MTAAQRLGFFGPAGLFQPFAIMGQIAPAMEWAAVVNNAPKRIHFLMLDVLEHVFCNPMLQIPRTVPANLREFLRHVMLLMRIILEVKQFIRFIEMIAVVIRADVHPIAEANAALTNMRALAHNQIFAAAILARSNQIGIAFAVVIKRRHLARNAVGLEFGYPAQQIDQRRQ